MTPASSGRAGDEASPRGDLAGDVAGARHALPRARHHRPRLGGRDRSVFDLRVRPRALRVVVGLADETMLRDQGFAYLGAGRYAEGASMMLRMLRVSIVPACSPTGRRGREERRGARRCYRRSAAPRRSGAPSPGPADAYPVATFLLFEQTYPTRWPRRSNCFTTAFATPIRATGPRRRCCGWRGCGGARVPPPRPRGARRPLAACSSTCSASSQRWTRKSSAATSAAPPRRRRW